MRETEFEGVPATIPYSFEKALTDEYGTKCLVVTEWEGYVANLSNGLSPPIFSFFLLPPSTSR